MASRCFGAAGIIIGPIVAALFVTIWEIYGATFQDLLGGPGGDAAGETGSMAAD